MANNHLLKIQNFLTEQGVLISFSGRFSQSIIEELGEALKNYLEEEQRPKNNIFNVFAIFIEQSQNIRNYSASKKDTAAFEKISQSCIVTIGALNETNYIYSGNLVENKDVEALVKRIEEIKPLDKDELKKLYKEKRKESINVDNGSAGLGLIDIARKASAPLEYSITKIDNEFSFFTLRVFV